MHNKYDQINQIQPSLKLTMEHTSPENELEEHKCDCPIKKKAQYLDKLLSIENGIIEIDLYKKQTDRNQYLLPSSCHPKTTTKASPFSLSLRTVRIGTKLSSRDHRLKELNKLLLARQYPESLVDRSTEEACNIRRKISLLKLKIKDEEKQPIYAVKYDPRMPALQPLLSKHYKSKISQNGYLN